MFQVPEKKLILIDFQAIKNLKNYLRKILDFLYVVIMLCLHCQDDFTSDEIQTSFLDIDNFPAFLSCVTNQVIVSAPVQSERNEALPLVVSTRTH